MPLKENEVDFMHRFKTGEMQAEPGTQLFEEGTKATQIYTVLSGMGIRYKTLENGRRQVISFVLPGDLIGLQAALMGEMNHSVASTTPMRLCVFNRGDMYELFKEQPERAYALTYLAAVEEHFLGDALTTVGQRGAMERIAWSLHRFFRRCEQLDLAEGNRAPLPFRQRDLADALGLSLVHTNKTLAKLRADNIVSWTDGELVVHDLEKLADVALVEGDSAPEPRPLI